MVARRKGNNWFIGAMGNEQPHDISVPLDFLGEGAFKAKIYQDGDTPTSLDRSERRVNASDVLSLKLAPSGGAAVMIWGHS